MNNYSESTPADVAIVGLGPVGLAAALQAAESDQRVLVFTDRVDYVRKQQVKLSNSYLVDIIKADFIQLKEKKRQRVELTEDEKADWSFCSKKDYIKSITQTNNITFQIKDIEAYLKRKLDHYVRQGLVTVVQSDRHRAVIRRIGTTDTCTYLEHGSQENTQRYYCRHLLAADGAKHQLAMKVKQDLGKDITYSLMPAQSKHPYHASIQLIVRRVRARTPTRVQTPGPLRNERKDVANKTDMAAFLVQQGWRKQDGLPHYYIFSYAEMSFLVPSSDSKKPQKVDMGPQKFCFTGEIPERIYRIKNLDQRKEELRLWAAGFIASQSQYAQYGITSNDLHYKDYTSALFWDGETNSSKREKKSALQACVFKMEGFRFCDQPLVPLAGGGYFANIGDAFLEPYYFSGNGITKGIHQGTSYVTHILKKPIDAQAYLRDAEKIYTEFNEFMLTDPEQKTVFYSENLTYRFILEGVITAIQQDVVAILPPELHQTKKEISKLIQEIKCTDEFERLCELLYALLGVMDPLRSVESVAVCRDIVTSVPDIVSSFVEEHGAHVERLQDSIVGSILVLDAEQGNPLRHVYSDSIKRWKDVMSRRPQVEHHQKTEDSSSSNSSLPNAGGSVGRSAEEMVTKKTRPGVGERKVSFRDDSFPQKDDSSLPSSKKP